MDTVYYNLKARRVKVSGGEELVTFVPAPAPAPAGEVLDFARCRQKLERKNAWRALERTAREPEETGELRESLKKSVNRPERRERAANWLELSATLAVLLVALSAAMAFFRLA